ncbi:hypothetical protein GALL_333860 [mine drainage metagenome]|uniref:Uncharacterized protein n=1 Tax=mine drainage metagenome TaxID=410659 RepID=A0A1J5QYH4_9ZZZZ
MNCTIWRSTSTSAPFSASSVSAIVALVIVVPSDKDWWVAPQPYPDFTMATPITRDDRRAASCSGLRPSQLTAPKTYTTPGDITRLPPPPKRNTPRSHSPRSAWTTQVDACRSRRSATPRAAIPPGARGRPRSTPAAAAEAQHPAQPFPPERVDDPGRRLPQPPKRTAPRGHSPRSA